MPLKRDAVLADLVEGDLVAVSLEESDGVLIADKIVVIPGKTKHRHLPGEIIAIDVVSGTDTRITIQPPAERAAPITFNRGPDTTVRFRQGATDLAIGNFVVILAARDPVTGELLPQAIEIHVVKREPGPSPKGPGIEAEVANTADIQGVFQGLDEDGNWLVGETTIAVNADTEIETAVAAGQLVKVEALLLPDGSLLALEIEVADEGGEVAGNTRLEGIFEGIDDQGNWIISGTPVFVGPAADTDGLPFIGQRVKVKAILREDGTLAAREVENKGGAHTEDDSSEVKLKGTFQGIDSEGNWIVNGTKVSVDPLTRLKGTPAIGQRIEVKAILLGDGSLLALKIEGKGKDPDKAKNEAKIRGIVDAIGDESITVNGITIAFSALTELEGDIQPGDYVEVKALLSPDGLLLAREVEGKGQALPGDIFEPSKAEIEGTITEVNQDGTLVVNGLTIAISPLSKIKGVLTEGAFVKIEGVLLPDGSLLAEEIKGEGRKATSSGTEVKVKGLLEAVNRDQDNNIMSVVINGLTIALDPLTKVEGPLEEGLLVEVKGIISNGEFLAGKIEVSEDEGPAGAPEIKIEGVIQAVQTDTQGRLIAITINGVEVKVGDADIEGELVIGTEVEITASVIQGAIQANEVEIEDRELDEIEDDTDEFELEGIVEAINLDIDDNIVSVVVNGQTVIVSPLTRVRGMVEVGSRVKVEGVINGEVYLASKIKADAGDSEEEVEVGSGDNAGGVSAQEESGENSEGNSGSGSEGTDEDDEKDDNKDTDTGEEQNKLKFEGPVASFTSTELVLEDGTSLVVNQDTEINGTLSIGVEVRVEVTVSGSALIATRIDVR